MNYLKSILIYCSGAIAILALLSLVSCECPPKNADGTKAGPCRYVGPNVTGSIGFQGVSVGVTLWGDTKPSQPPTIPPSIVGIPINTK